MKKMLLSLCIVVSNYSQAQVHTAMPPDANTFYDKAMPLVKSSLKNLIIAGGDSFKKQACECRQSFYRAS